MKKPSKSKGGSGRRAKRRRHLEWVKDRAKAVPAWQQNAKGGKPVELVPAPDGSRVLVVEEPVA
jgi:hypothetical protein